MKYLPPASFETEEEAPFSPPKVHSCRFPMKVMYLTVVCPPSNGNDGKILLLRVCNEEETKRSVTHQKFCSDFLVNKGIKDGEWKLLLSDPLNMSICKVLDSIASHYQFSEDIADNLVLRYNTITENNKEKLITLTNKERRKMKEFSVRNKNGVERRVQLTNLTLYVLQPKGTVVENDCSCDSSFMMNHI